MIDICLHLNRECLVSPPTGNPGSALVGPSHVYRVSIGAIRLNWKSTNFLLPTNYYTNLVSNSISFALSHLLGHMLQHHSGFSTIQNQW